MNFGVRLPGPFRVGISSSGRVNAGVTLGPISASTNVSGGRKAGSQEVFFPVGMETALAELVKLGWNPAGSDGDGRAVIVTKGWTAVQVDAVEGGVTLRRITSRRTVIAWTVGLAAVFVLLAVLF